MGKRPLRLPLLTQYLRIILKLTIFPKLSEILGNVQSFPIVEPHAPNLERRAKIPGDSSKRCIVTTEEIDEVYLGEWAMADKNACALACHVRPPWLPDLLL